MSLVRLGKYCTVRNGYAFSSSEFTNEGIPVIRISDVTENGATSTNAQRIKQDDKHERFAIKKNNILIAMSGATTGKFSKYLSEEKAYQNQRVGCFIIQDENTLDNNFLYYCLFQLRKQIEKKAYGGAQPNISATDIENLLIPLPSLPEQKHIAEVLSKAEALIAERKQSIQLLDEYLKSTFLEMFGDPVKNEKGWDIKAISSLLKRPSINGHYVPKELYSQNGTEMVHMSDLFYDIVQRGSLKRVDISDKEKTKYELTSNDILIARRSLNPEGAAKACLIPHSNEPLIFESSMIRLTPNIDTILPLYLFYYLNNERAKKHYVLKHITKSTISGINQSNLNKIEVVVPPLKLQSQFAAIVEKTETLKVQYKEHLQSLEQMYGALSQRAFRGELFSKYSKNTEVFNIAAEEKVSYRKAKK